MGYTIVSKKTSKRIHPGVKVPTFKTKAKAKKWLAYQAKGMPKDYQRGLKSGSSIVKTKARKRTTARKQPSWANFY